MVDTSVFPNFILDRGNDHQPDSGKWDISRLPIFLDLTVNPGSIFATENVPEIDFSELDLDLVLQGAERPLSQFLTQPVFECVLRVYLEEVQALSDAITGLIKGYNLRNARGVALDHIGARVGTGRVAVALERTDVEPEFIFDREDHGWDQGLWDITGLPQFIRTGTILDDERFRRRILSRIFYNHTHHGSQAELIGFARFFDNRITFRRVGPMVVDLVVTGSLLDDPVRLIELRENITIIVADLKERDTGELTVPFATTISIRNVVYETALPFIYDRANHGYDQGMWSVRSDAENFLTADN